MTRLGTIVFRHARLILCAGILFAALAGITGGSVTKVLEAGGFEDPGSQSMVAADELTEVTGADPGPGIVATVDTSPAPVLSPLGRARVARVVRAIRAEPLVAKVTSVLGRPHRALISRNGQQTYLVAYFGPASENEAREVARRIAERLDEIPGAKAGGPILNETQIDDQVEIDLKRVELVALPVLLLLSFLVFRGLVAAVLPVLIAAVSVTSTFMAMRLLGEAVSLSVFSLNLVTGLGLGLAIDYALFVVSRYREEIAIHGPGLEAIQRTLATAGRTVAFSGVTVAAALLSLLVFPQRFLYSMGIGGSIATLSAVVAALTALPAALVLLGDRVNALAPARLQRSGRRASTQTSEGGWYKLARFVMRRPVGTAMLATLALVVLSLPALQVNLIQGDRHVLPGDYSARQVTDALDEKFSVDATNPVIVTLDAPPGAGERLARYAASLSSLPAVAEVGTPYEVAAGKWRVDVVTKSNPMTRSSQDLVERIREMPAPGRHLVTGEAAVLLDVDATLESRLPLAILILGAVTITALFLMTGSVLLPIKSLLMNVLTLTAAFGVLVVIFQKGNLESVLGFASSGSMEQTNMVLLSVLVFSLSTDYGVFLIARIKEAYDAGASNREAVAIGLERTGRVVSAAALLFCVAIGTLVTSEIVIVKTLGLGAAIAVLIDATVIRAFLVPALMVLLGRFNWWAPASLRSLHHRLGVAETPATPSS
ncbi:MAG TPA: MMPL family transporter [Solirubrobacterales bacterium]|jgi:RND superfamily putative drug exporter|nr:MMPL family transporter [Solirubrobacterales bacterium]